MRRIKFLNRVLTRGMKTIRMNGLAYRMSPDIFFEINDKNVRQAREFLETQSPNPRTSCFCKNEINGEVDLHIIIPAYNAEAYIESCLNSVVVNPSTKYTYHVTVVNDGSTDQTENLLHNYETNSSVEIIKQENKGFSGARNTGLKQIKGKYIFFLDSDDCLDWTGVEKLLDVANEKDADIVVGSYTTMYSNGKVKKFHPKSVGEVSSQQLGGQPWAKVFKAELFSDLCYPEKYWYEDSIFAQIIYPKVKKTYGVSENTYYYRLHANSISFKSRNYIKSVDSYWITEQLFHERQQVGLKNTESYYDYILRMVKLTFHRIMFQDRKVKESVFVLFVDFISRNFNEYSTKDDELKKIERIIKTRNFGKCVAYSKWR